MATQGATSSTSLITSITSSVNAATSISSVASTLSTSVKSSFSANPSDWTGGTDPSPTGIDTNAGASGSDNGQSFNLSQGGLIAIIVVVAVVVILGSKYDHSCNEISADHYKVASTVLFVIAKRRQINIRQSIVRMSRRMTGRGPPPARRDNQARRADKRSGIGPYSNLQNNSSEKKNAKVAVKPVGR